MLAEEEKDRSMRWESPETDKLCSVRILFMMRVIFHISEEKMNVTHTFLGNNWPNIKKKYI